MSPAESWPRGRSVDGGLDQILLPDPAGATGIWLCGKRVVGPDPAAALTRIDQPGSVGGLSGSSAEGGAIVCLCEEPELGDRYPDYVAWLRANADDRALWRPIPDLSAPPLEQARAIAADIGAQLDLGRSVIVHCGAGMGRAPTLAACALIARGHDRSVVLDAIGASRPMAGPENGAQQALVERFQ